MSLRICGILLPFNDAFFFSGKNGRIIRRLICGLEQRQNSLKADARTICNLGQSCLSASRLSEEQQHGCLHAPNPGCIFEGRKEGSGFGGLERLTTGQCRLDSRPNC
jgi:hypothetical protein